MNREEALCLLDAKLDTYRQMSYVNLVARIGREEVVELTGASGSLPPFLAFRSGSDSPTSNDFDAAVRIAHAEFDQGRTDVVVGSSRGGVAAMNIDTGDTSVVLLCPVWNPGALPRP